jgi:hypothetical protein
MPEVRLLRGGPTGQFLISLLRLSGLDYPGQALQIVLQHDSAAEGESGF